MRHEESARTRRARTTWPRRAVVSLWVAACVLGGFTLAARWDLLMARLARPPVGGVEGGALR